MNNNTWRCLLARYKGFILHIGRNVCHSSEIHVDMPACRRHRPKLCSCFDDHLPLPHFPSLLSASSPARPALYFSHPSLAPQPTPALRYCPAPFPRDFPPPSSHPNPPHPVWCQPVPCPPIPVSMKSYCDVSWHGQHADVADHASYRIFCPPPTLRRTCILRTMIGSWIHVLQMQA